MEREGDSPFYHEMINAGVQEVDFRVDPKQPLVVTIYKYKGTPAILQHVEQLSPMDSEGMELVVIDQLAQQLWETYPGDEKLESFNQVVDLGFNGSSKHCSHCSSSLVYKDGRAVYIVIAAGQHIAAYTSLRIAQAVAAEVN